MGYIAGIGGANMDIHGRSDRQLIMRDSNPGSLHTSLGGVCRNICENLARLGERRQILLFTCQNREAAYLSGRPGVHIISLE